MRDIMSSRSRLHLRVDHRGDAKLLPIETNSAPIIKLISLLSSRVMTRFRLHPHVRLSFRISVTMFHSIGRIYDLAHRPSLFGEKYDRLALGDRVDGLGASREGARWR